MATSEAIICNKALGHLGIKSYIDALTDTGIEEAETANVYYADTRDACLAAFPWPFATLRKALAEVDYTLEPARDGYDRVFRLPEDCLAPRKIWPAGQAVRALRSDERFPYAIEKSSTDDGQVLLCDLESPVLFYTAKFADVSKFPPLFTEALSWLLAAEMAMPLTVKMALEDMARKRYREKISEARANAMNEQQEDQPPETESIAARR